MLCGLNKFNKFKYINTVSKTNVSHVRPISDCTIEQYRGVMKFVADDGLNLRFIAESAQTYEMRKLAIQQNGLSLQYIDAKYQTTELCISAIIKDPVSLKYVANQTKYISMLAVKIAYWTLQYVENQTEEICEFAIKQNPDAIYYVRNKTHKLWRLALQMDGLMLRHLTNSTNGTVNYDIWTYDLFILAVQQNGLSLGCIPTRQQTLELVELALHQNKDAAQYVKIQRKYCGLCELDIRYGKIQIKNCIHIKNCE